MVGLKSIWEPKTEQKMAQPYEALTTLFSPFPSSSATANNNSSSARILLLLPSDSSSASRHHSSTPKSISTSRPRLGFRKPFRCHSWRRGRYTEEEEEEEEDASGSISTVTFGAAVDQFNRRQYYECHDSLEALWMGAEDEASRTLFHGILQCAVGFHHLFNQNHKGAMMELGEGLCKLRKLDFQTGPFRRFEEEISAVLEFIYLTQLQLAACTEDICLAMDQTEISYQLLGGYGAGQKLYGLETELSGGGGVSTFVTFVPPLTSGDKQKVKLPTLGATHEHLLAITRRR
ncbi:unnamed protein product [Linum tenue]|uniref:DUF309 domain-containing protein n=1 Tax=Linum tenue TaxID=586396 RepID=A0AAV0M789_9ROSI|nr:unnamed protein product [Linum tenue]